MIYNVVFPLIIRTRTNGYFALRRKYGISPKFGFDAEGYIHGSVENQHLLERGNGNSEGLIPQLLNEMDNPESGNGRFVMVGN